MERRGGEKSEEKRRAEKRRRKEGRDRREDEKKSRKAEKQKRVTKNEGEMLRRLEASYTAEVLLRRYRCGGCIA